MEFPLGGQGRLLLPDSIEGWKRYFVQKLGFRHLADQLRQSTQAVTFYRLRNLLPFEVKKNFFFPSKQGHHDTIFFFFVGVSFSLEITEKKKMQRKF